MNKLRQRKDQLMEHINKITIVWELRFQPSNIKGKHDSMVTRIKVHTSHNRTMTGPQNCQSGKRLSNIYGVMVCHIQSCNHLFTPDFFFMRITIKPVFLYQIPQPKTKKQKRERNQTTALAFYFIQKKNSKSKQNNKKRSLTRICSCSQKDKLLYYL